MSLPMFEGMTRVGKNMRVAERAKLPERLRGLYFSDWIVLYPSGWGAGVSNRETAFRMAEEADATADQPVCPTHTVH